MSAGAAGFIGVGMMGTPMASRLHHAGFRLSVFDAAHSAAEKFCAGHKGATLGRDMRLGKEVLALWKMGAERLGKTADHTEMYRFLGELEAGAR